MVLVEKWDVDVGHLNSRHQLDAGDTDERHHAGPRAHRSLCRLVAMSLTAQALLFGALVVALVLIGRQVYGSLDATPGLLPQSRAHALVGEDFFLDEAIVHGYGRIRVGDSSWRVAGDDCPSGAKVRVVAVEDGSLLRVTRV
jgi:membrane protein implicated in regulation of membrane protease activity